MKEQPESNIRLIIELLQTMSPYKGVTETKGLELPFRRTGLANGTVQLPKDFDKHFDEMDKEISELFYRG